MGDGRLDTGVVVSVVIPVWNVEPWLAACLDSVLGQTIGLASLEVIAVDDGSTDGSGAILAAYAARHAALRVVHQPNSGGPGGPRNTALELARGRYVFFLDADDYLGPEALERLVAMAERNGSDIVLGRLVGIEGRRVYLEQGLWARNRDRADLALVTRSCNVLKLFRRSFLERTGLRFDPAIAGGEDGDFMARAYPAARVVSIVADYDCYFVRSRPGSQTNRPDRADDPATVIERLERTRFAATRSVRWRPRARRALLHRHLVKVAAQFRGRWSRLDPAARRRGFEAGAAVVGRWLAPGAEGRLPAWARIRTWCLANGRMAELETIAATPIGAAYRDPLIEDGRAYARFPHFRDGSGIPDACFDTTREAQPVVRPRAARVSGDRLVLEGSAWLRMIGGTPTVLLRRLPFGPRLRLSTGARATPDLREKRVAYPAAGFAVALPLGALAGGRPIGTGTWAIEVEVGTGGFRRTAPMRIPGWRLAEVLGAPGPGADTGAEVAPADVAATLRTDADGRLRLVVGSEGLAGVGERLAVAVRRHRRDVGGRLRQLRRRLTGRGEAHTRRRARRAGDRRPRGRDGQPGHAPAPPPAPRSRRSGHREPTWSTAGDER